MMTLDEFELLMARYGSATHNWPLEERAVAERLLQSSLPARKALDEARRVDRLLGDVEPVRAPSRLQADILARVNAEIVRKAQPEQRGFSFWRGLSRSLWPQMVGFAAASLLGVMVGAQSMSPLPDDVADASDYVLGYDVPALTVSMLEEQE